MTSPHRIADAIRGNAAVVPLADPHRLLVEHIDDLVLGLRGDRITWISPSCSVVTGSPPASLIGRPFLSIVHAEDRLQTHHTHCSLGIDESAVVRFRVQRTDGGSHWVEDHIKRYTDDIGEASVHALRIIDDRVAIEHDLHRRASFDDLTGLMNRHAMRSRLAFPRERREPGQRIAVLFCDVDGLKTVNDTFGHRAGDTLLHHVAQGIRDSIRSADLAARIGGDEFVVLLDEIQSIDDALMVAEKMRAAARRPVVIGGAPMSATVSIGVILASASATFDELVEQADRAMYRAKHGGRDRVHLDDLPT